MLKGLWPGLYLAWKRRFTLNCILARRRCLQYHARQLWADGRTLNWPELRAPTNLSAIIIPRNSLLQVMRLLPNVSGCISAPSIACAFSEPRQNQFSTPSKDRRLTWIAKTNDAGRAVLQTRRSVALLLVHPHHSEIDALALRRSNAAKTTSKTHTRPPSKAERSIPAENCGPVPSS